ncbi:cellulose binding domain-containing protein [Lachnotalea glycerini]|uniref:VWA domain-containing protein n=1 Tax=Lachnotalea glycerini TaxID=1763509 RepID=A0A371JJF5_9FIRM|nr:cellulose binding domain-containing protein [Lachnotalea glycerini]RDY32837.1 VWA domain-containing protein [Lachnotalea glycerini]
MKKGMKKIISFILTLSLLLSFSLTNNDSVVHAKTEEAEEDLEALLGEEEYECENIGFDDDSIAAQTASSDIESDTIRDTVLILDASSSMNGTPVSTMKSAAVKFCNTVLEASGANRVAIVVYGSDVKGRMNFSSDISQLTTFIESIGASGGTNITSALVAAKSIMDSYSSADAIKNMLILTDGLPQSGLSQANGKYNSIGPKYSYPYANYAYKYYVDNLQDNYNVYALGFFHSISSSYLPFVKQFLSDIQNKGYYQVTNADELEFTFGDIAEEITKPETDCPIIIVPGEMGSQLYSDTEKVWDPSLLQVINPLFRLDDYLSINKVLNVHNYDYDANGQATPVNQALLSEGSREYGATSLYKNLVDGIIDKFTDTKGNHIRNVYFYSYDFRYGNTDSAKGLSQYISDILADNPEFKQVDIVAHSMGGLVTSSYVKNYGSEKIRKVITAGTPFEGAPKWQTSVLTYQVLDNFLADLALVSLGGLTKSCKASFPAFAELAPTESYFKANDTLFTQYSGKLERVGFLKWNKIFNSLDLDSYHAINRIIFNDNYDKALSFYKDIKNDAGYDALADLDDSYFAIGINQKTISGIVFNSATTLSSLSVDDLVYETKGDGIVPYDSSTMIKQLESLPNGRVSYFSTSHTGLIAKNTSDENSVKAFDWILDILSTGSSKVANDPVKLKGHLVIRIACPVDVNITKNGETLSSDSNDIQNQTSYGVLDLIGENGDIKMLCLDDAADYNIIMNGTGKGTMDYSIRYFDSEDQLVNEYKFTDLPITEDTVITTGSDQSDMALHIDENNDGIVDYDFSSGNYLGHGTMEKISDTSYVYNSDIMEVKYEITDQYDNIYHVNTSIKNKTDETIHDWILAFDSTDKIDKIWDGIIDENKDGTVIRNAKYNQDIKPGETVSFVYMSTFTDKINIPTYFYLLNQLTSSDINSYQATYQIDSDWTTGYNASVILTNKTEETIEDWRVEFDFTDKIDDVWGAKLVSSEDGHYVLENEEFKQNIEPGQAIIIGFTVSSREEACEPTNFILNNITKK